MINRLCLSWKEHWWKESWFLHAECSGSGISPCIFVFSLFHSMLLPRNCQTEAHHTYAFIRHACCVSSLSPCHAIENTSLVKFKSVFIALRRSQAWIWLPSKIQQNYVLKAFRSLGLVYNCYLIVYHLLSSSEANNIISKFRQNHQNILYSSLRSVRLNINSVTAQ